MNHKLQDVAIAERGPITTLILVLLVVFFGEIVVMFIVLPLLFPSPPNEFLEAVLDALLLTVTSAPILWVLLIGPLQRIAAAERAKAASIIRTAVDAILTIDADGRIETANVEAGRQFAEPSLVGQPVDNFLPELTRDTFDEVRSMEVTARRADGATFPALVSVSRFDVDGQTRVTAIVHDLTELRESQERRIEAVRETEAVRTQQMATLAQVATGVAHEIRNPLTAVKMLIQSSAEDLEQAGFPKEDVQLIDSEIRRMEQSLNTLLDFARPPQPKRRRISLSDVLARTIRLIEGRAERHNVLIEFDADANDTHVQADFEQMQQLFVNLCLNAIDVMPNGGQLNLKIDQPQENQVRVCVCDTGPGIPDDEMERLFDPFFTTKETGVGLGLGISQRIAQDHGGKIEARNRQDAGACFDFRMPLRC